MAGFDAVLDRHGIAGGEKWEERIGELITNADVIVFILSPSSLKSDVCQWEVDEAAKLGKRIIPVVCRHLEKTAPPVFLSKLNYVYFYQEKTVPSSSFATGLGELVEALKVDIDWLREHTRIVSLARSWLQSSRPKHRLLKDEDVIAAQRWAAARPESAPVFAEFVKQFIAESEEADIEAKKSEQERLKKLADARQAKIIALQDKEEAEKQEKIATAKVVRRTKIGLAVTVILSTGLAIASVYALKQSKSAQLAQTQAEQARYTAELHSKTAITMATRILKKSTPIFRQQGVTPQKLIEILQPIDDGLAALSSTTTKNLPSYFEAITVMNLSTAKVYEGAGDTKEARSLTDRALQMLDSALLNNKHENRLRRLWAETHAQLGDMESARGNLEIALSHFSKAQSAMNDLVAEYSQDLELRSLQANITLRAGAAARRNDNFIEARKNYEAAHAVYVGMIALAEDEAEARLNASFALYDVATIYHENHDFDQALKHYQELRKIREELLKSEPDNVRIERLLAWAFSIESEIHQEIGNFAQAENLQNRMLEIRRQIYSRNSDHRIHVRDLAWAYFTIAERLRLSGHFAKSLENMERALDYFRELLLGEPKVSDNIRRVAWTLRHVGLLNTFLGDFDQAEAAFQEADDKFLAAIELAPTQIWWLTEHAMSISDFGFLYDQMGKIQKASKAYLRAREIFLKIPERKLERANRREARQILADRISALNKRAKSTKVE